MAARKANSRADKSSELMASLKSFALGLPGAWPDNPWGDSVVKVGKKIFVFLGEGAEESGITVKVPESHDHAMSFAGAVPTGYGLGKAGWVTIPVAALGGDDAEVLHDFVEESYRTIAPKKLIKELDAQNEADSDGTR
ncbi:MAG TPA: MmcQ/YjbR family DNA-binding protein [Ilumatobacteraceae bacterium]|nr:MmcQ/YjbR family DNA-binding protein [Ilumatobacteraceae bacterium]